MRFQKVLFWSVPVSLSPCLTTQYRATKLRYTLKVGICNYVNVLRVYTLAEQVQFLGQSLAKSNL